MRLFVSEENMNTVIKFSVTDQAIAELKQKHGGIVVNFGDTKGYKALSSAIAEIRIKRGEVETTRKELKADALEYGRKVDAEAKRITAALEEIEQPLKGMKEAYDTEVERVKAEKLAQEAARIAAIQAKISRITNAPAKASGKDSTGIKEALEALQAYAIDDSFQELAGQADLAKSEAVAALQQMLVEREAFEAAEVERKAKEAAEIEARRAEAERLVAEAELLRKEREVFAEQQRIANEQANVARLAEQALREKQEAEARQQREAEQAELRKQQAELARQQAAIKAERERLERAEAERIEAEKIARDKAERKAREEALRPDLEKLKAYASEFVKDLPVMSTEDGFAMRDCLRVAVESIIEKWDV